MIPPPDNPVELWAFRYTNGRRDPITGVEEVLVRASGSRPWVDRKHTNCRHHKHLSASPVQMYVRADRLDAIVADAEGVRAGRLGDAAERLERERDAFRDRVDLLSEALRQVAIRGMHPKHEHGVVPLDVLTMVVKARDKDAELAGHMNDDGYNCGRKR